MNNAINKELITIISNNDSLPDRLKSHMIDTIERASLKPSSISLNGRIITIALGGTDAIHADNHCKLVFFEGVVRSELIVNKGLYNQLMSYYNEHLNPNTNAK